MVTTTYFVSIIWISKHGILFENRYNKKIQSIVQTYFELKQLGNMSAGRHMVWTCSWLPCLPGHRVLRISQLSPFLFLLWALRLCKGSKLIASSTHSKLQSLYVSHTSSHLQPVRLHECSSLHQGYAGGQPVCWSQDWKGQTLVKAGAQSGAGWGLAREAQLGDGGLKKIEGRA